MAGEIALHLEAGQRHDAELEDSIQHSAVSVQCSVKNQPPVIDFITAAECLLRHGAKFSRAEPLKLTNVVARYILTTTKSCFGISVVGQLLEEIRMEYIPNEAITLELIPVPEASWDVIEDFALSFPGYTIHGSFDKCAEIANAQRRETLSDLRTCLFFEQRRWRHFGQVPDKDALSYIQSLVEEIRVRVVEAVPQKKIAMADYKKELITRYWVYQKEIFPDIKNHFERPFVPIGRPPVFHKHKAWENIITRPGASQEETSQLLGLVREGERHKWFRSMNSSQALSQSVLGNLAVYGFWGSLTELLDDDGMALLGKAQVLPGNFGMEFKVDYLGEPRPTSLDGYIRGDYRVAIECKFTESEVGTCSRPRLTPAASNYDSEYCNGTYTKQRARKERCSLTEIGVLYWQYVQQLFRWNSMQDLVPCPLNTNYQLVRNILAIGVRRDGQVLPANGHVVLIYDERNAAFQKGGKGFIAFTETRQSLREWTMLRKCSWQRVVQHMRHKGILPWLTEQLALKYGL